MQVHFIAIGGSVMHQLALALFKKGYTVSGSGDKIFEPAWQAGWIPPQLKRTTEPGSFPEYIRHGGPNKPGCLLVLNEAGPECVLQMKGKGRKKMSYQPMVSGSMLLKRVMSPGNFDGADMLTFVVQVTGSNH